MIEIDVNEMLAFLDELLNIPSPTGDTEAAIAFCARRFSELPLTIERSTKGYLVGRWKGANSGRARGLTAHVDTLGAMVREIKANGRIKLTQLGGYSWHAIEGEGVTIFTGDGRQYRGSVMPTAASIHAHLSHKRDSVRTDDNMEVRIDARTSSAAETHNLGIQVGDIVSLDPRVERGEHGFIRSRHLDDKSSVACIFAAVKGMVAAGIEPQQDVIIHISNYEEVGHGGATGFPAEMDELVTIDMAVVAPRQTSSEFAVTICAKDSGGPYDLGLRRRLESLAAESGIPYRVDIYPYYRSDGGAYWRAGGDVRVALIGPGVDASHHYERTHTDGLVATARLVASYLQSPS